MKNLDLGTLATTLLLASSLASASTLPQVQKKGGLYGGASYQPSFTLQGEMKEIWYKAPVPTSDGTAGDGGGPKTKAILMWDIPTSVKTLSSTLYFEGGGMNGGTKRSQIAY